METVQVEKGFTKSKKFLFAVFSVLVIAGILITVTFTQGAAAAPALICGLFTIGFISVGVVLGQAYIDKYVRGQALQRRDNKTDVG